MAWISDLSANRFNNTYFRDAHDTGFAVDMSGDLVVRGQIRNDDTGKVDISGDLVVQNGNLGIGTTNPFFPLHVERSTGAGTGGGFPEAARYYIGYSIDGRDVGTGTSTGTGIFSHAAIVTNDFLMSHEGSYSASDIRIKKNIIDVEDDSALTMLRILKPKTYGYNDVINKGNETVYGFIAQEVGEIIPQSVQKMQDSIPNIYQLVTVGNDNKTICFYQGFNTQDLDASSNTLKILDKEVKEHFVNIEEIIDASYIRVDTDLSNMMGDVDESGNVIEGNKVFVYGQRVDDFHFLKKDAIWTVATAALQEVDRQLQAEKTKVATLESQLADVLTRLTALESA